MKRGWSGSLTPKLHLFPVLLTHPLPLISAPQVWFQGRDLAGPSLDNQAEQVWVWPPASPQTRGMFVEEKPKGGRASETLSECQPSPGPMSPGPAFLTGLGAWLGSLRAKPLPLS